MPQPSDPPEHLDLYAVLDSLPDGVTLADSEGRIFFSNRAADRILGVGPAVGASPDDWSEYYGVFLPDGTTEFPTDQYPLVRALAGEETKDVEMLVRNAVLPDGALIAVSGRALRDQHGGMAGAAVVFRDVTVLRQTQRDLAEAVDRLTFAQRAKDELTSFVVHDMKNPLTAILGGCHLLGTAELAEQARTDVASIREAAERLHRMVLDLLDVQLTEDGALDLDLGSFPIGQLVRDVVRASELLVRAKGQRIEIEGSGEEEVLGDRRLVERVLLNLVDNCVKYSPSGGGIWLGVEPAADHVLVTVRDEGPGVPPDLRERIFEKYARSERDERVRSATSRGLGLRFCRVVMEAHGGDVWVEDGVPSGAKFCVQLARAGRSTA